MTWGSLGGTPPWSGEKGPGQNGEAAIKGDVLLKTPGEGKLHRTPMWLVGTTPDLVIRHLANPTCAPAVSLTPCLLAKPLLQKPCQRVGRKGSPSLPVMAAPPGELRGPCWWFWRWRCTGRCHGRKGSVLHIDCPFLDKSAPEVTCCSISRKEEL